MILKWGAVTSVIATATVLLTACTNIHPQAVEKPSGAEVASVTTPTDDRIDFVKLVNPPSQPPTANLVYTSNLSVVVADGSEYQALWLKDGELIHTGGREPVEWPAPVPVRLTDRYSATIGTVARPQSILIQMFEEVNELGVPVGPPINVLDCASDDLKSDQQCRLFPTDTGILTIHIPPVPRERTVYISEFVSWLDDRGADDGVDTVSVTWLYRLSVELG